MLPKNFPARKKMKHEEAVARQTTYDAMSVKEKLARLDLIEKAGGGRSARQRARLEALAPAPEPSASVLTQEPKPERKKSQRKKS